MNRADLTAHLTAAWDTPDPLVVLIPAHPATRPGWQVWGLLGGAALTVLPAPLPGAPPELLPRLGARAACNLLGRCPLCGAVAGLNTDPEHGGGAGWQVLPLTVGLSHEPECPALFTEEDRRWFDPRAVGRSAAPEEGR